MTVSPSRAAALRMLMEVRTREAWGHEILARALPALGLSDRDAAHATRLVYGVLASEGTLDEALARYVDRPNRVHPKVRDALRLAAYEMLFLDTPHRVAVHQGVDAVRVAQSGAAGFANAVLRRLAEDAAAFPWGDPDTDLDALARATAHPAWLARLFVEELGAEEASLMMAANNDPAPLYLAHNPFRGSFEDLLSTLRDQGADPEPWGPAGCVRAGHAAAAVRSGAVRDGACVVSDAAAQFVASLAAPGPGRRAVELAAGRGTKTLLMQAASVRHGGSGAILSADLHEFKISLLERRIADLCVPGVSVRVVDTAAPAAVEALGGPCSADVAFVDAPCSGLGTLRRHPEKRWRLQPANIDEFAVIAGAMLANAARLVRPGGFVVYSTCTVTERENQQVVQAFLGSEAGGGFRTRPLAGQVPAGWERFVTGEGWFRSIPTPGGPDGHFAAVLESV